jgi:hypothetical protein
MKCIKLFALLLLAVGCTPDKVEVPNCDCGTIVKVEKNANDTQRKYTLKNDCGEVRVYESRSEFVEVGFRKCN